MKIPQERECLKILEEVKLPEHIVAHSKAVCRVALEVAENLERRGVEVNKGIIIASALLHDVKKLEPYHEKAGARFLEERGLKEIAKVVRKHCLNIDVKPETIEEKIVFYADKRVNEDKIVSLEERFKYLKEKYGISDDFYHYTKKIEEELIG